MGMFLKKPLMKRRTFLRGTLAGVSTVAVGLPALDAMLDENGKALGQDTIPDRFGLWFFGNGVKPDRWIPGTEGAGWTPSAELAPLEGVRDWVSVVTGCEIKTATHPHHSGMTGVLTGSRYHQLGTTRDTIVTTFAGPSVDMIAAAHFEGSTPFRSLELGITRFRGTDEGTTFQHLSHNGPNNVNPSEYSPNRLFMRLFGMPLDSDVDLARRSVLDAVMGQVRGLQGRVGSRDRARLEQHFESVRTLEQRLAAGVSACMEPANPGDFPDVEGREQIEQQNRAMSDLLVTALACDLTRSFSVLFSPAGSGVVVWPVGARNSLHQICHDEPNPQPTVHAAVVFTMEQLAYFLERMRDTVEGDGTLLDHSSILITSELADGWNHSNREFPLLVAGRGNGRLRGGVHYRSRSNESTSHAVLTALRGAGLPLESFGTEAGQVTSSIGALEG
jgi:hypothetical protein